MLKEVFQDLAKLPAIELAYRSQLEEYGNQKREFRRFQRKPLPISDLPFWVYVALYFFVAFLTAITLRWRGGAPWDAPPLYRDRGHPGDDEES
ncbi:MAG: hypothetical protein ABIP48_22030 [Planctomycetota bacterium]